MTAANPAPNMAKRTGILPTFSGETILGVNVESEPDSVDQGKNYLATEVYADRNNPEDNYDHLNEQEEGY